MESFGNCPQICSTRPASCRAGRTPHRSGRAIPLPNSCTDTRHPAARSARRAFRTRGLRTYRRRLSGRATRRRDERSGGDRGAAGEVVVGVDRVRHARGRGAAVRARVTHARSLAHVPAEVGPRRGAVDLLPLGRADVVDVEPGAARVGGEPERVAQTAGVDLGAALVRVGGAGEPARTSRPAMNGLPGGDAPSRVTRSSFPESPARSREASLRRKQPLSPRKSQPPSPTLTYR